MLSSFVIFNLLLAGVVSAAAVPAPLLPRTLTENDVIVWGKNGRIEVMNKTSYALLVSTSSPSFDLNAPTPSNTLIISTSAMNATQPSKVLEARCSKERLFTLNPATTFLNWDVPMSSIVHATTATTTIAVTQGYSIANSVSVGVSSQLTLIEDFLSTTFSIDYTQTWTSTYSAAYSFAVPEGKYAAVVSNPLTTRHSGHVDIGCIGVEGESIEFQADSYSSKSYDSLAWVDGVISLCTGDSYPLRRCLGAGSL
jgi:murein DD-endopeptidase MepM/ murein hydrolase activator NlpD